MQDADEAHFPAQHRILVVDDDGDWRESLRMALEGLGYQVDEAGNGADALRALERVSYAVVLLDHYMPGMSGEEVVRRLPPASAAKVKVVLVTSAQADEVQGALAQGAFYYLPKGASEEHLALLLRSLVL